MKDSISENTDSTDSVNPSDKQDPLSDEACKEALKATVNQYGEETLTGSQRYSYRQGWQEATRRARDYYEHKEGNAINANNGEWSKIADKLNADNQRLRDALKHYADYFPKPNIAAQALEGKE